MGDKIEVEYTKDGYCLVSDSKGNKIKYLYYTKKDAVKHFRAERKKKKMRSVS